MFIMKPVRAICPTVIRPLPKTIAFGGVATGIMNAMEAESVAGTMRKRG